jgi:hypothetical protein
VGEAVLHAWERTRQIGLDAKKADTRARRIPAVIAKLEG